MKRKVIRGKKRKKKKRGTIDKIKQSGQNQNKASVVSAALRSPSLWLLIHWHRLQAHGLCKMWHSSGTPVFGTMLASSSHTAPGLKGEKG